MRGQNKGTHVEGAPHYPYPFPFPYPYPYPYPYP